MDVLVLIDKLDDLVHNARPVPLTDQVRVDREEIYDLLDQMRATIPEEIKQARWIVKERQEMLAQAKRDAEKLGDALARAFSDDPGFSHVLPNSADRTERLRIFFETELREVALPRGLVWTTEEVVGAAVWGPPDGWRVPLTRSIRDGPAMLRAFGRRLPLAL